MRYLTVRPFRLLYCTGITVLLILMFGWQAAVLASLLTVDYKPQ